MSLPERVYLREVGPREGFQIEPRVYPTDEKVRLIERLAQTGLPEIEVTSFVRPDRVPQMADAEELVAKLRVFPGVRYSAVYLNARGLERALATGKLQLRHSLTVSASEAFSIRNSNMTLEQRFDHLEALAEMFRQRGVSDVRLGVSTAFGCNYEGDITLDRVMALLDRLDECARRHGLAVSEIWLLDTMGWANPEQVTRSVNAIREKWPGVPIGLHLHDTRGLGIANAYAGLKAGATLFDASVGGMGGCPFAGNEGAAGNIATEEFVFLCNEIGVQTGVDLDALIEVVGMAESIVGHPLPSKLKSGGTLERFRKAGTRPGA